MTERANLPALGMRPGMTEAEYRAAPGANKSFLDDIAISPALARWRRMNPEPPTEAMAIGSAFHCLVLEPDRFEERYVASPFEDYTSKAAREWRADVREQGVTPLRAHSDDPVRSPSEWDRVHRMRDAVMTHPYASALLLDEGPTETPVFWIDPETNRLCKGLLDKWCAGHHLIADLKKVPVEKGGMSAWARKVHEYRYHVQAAFYLDGMRLNLMHPRAFVFVVVEEEPPYQVALYTLPDEWLAQGRTQYQRDLVAYGRCLDSGEWPAYPAEIRECEMPGYARFATIT